MWAGYTLILLVDKVLFDTSDLFKEDPAAAKLARELRNSVVHAETTGENLDEKVQEALDNYADKNDKFATRMAASLKTDEQNENIEKIMPSRINITDNSTISAV